MTPTLNRIVLTVVTITGVAAVFAIPDHNAVAMAILVAIGALSGTFVALYGTRSAWQSTIAGRIIMRLMLCLALLGVHGAVNAITDAGYPLREYIRPLLLLGVAVAILDLLLRLLWLQRRSEGSEVS